MVGWKYALGLLVLGGTLWAQTEIRVYPASLVAGSPVPGKLILLGDTLAFVDDERPEVSFAVTKSNIGALNNENDAVTLQLRQAIRDRAGAATRVIIRLATPSEGAAVQRWFSGNMALSGPAGFESASALTFSAQRKKRFRSNTDGKLIVDAERIIFESTDNASDSRRWELKEIKELKLKNPYELQVRTFRGEKYDLTLSGAGMDNSQYREIVNRVTQARTAR